MASRQVCYPSMPTSSSDVSAVNMTYNKIFGATWLQVLTYLGGVAMGSIGLLVFLNASISFVITDVIHQNNQVGDATGTLGFADELCAIILSPISGYTADKIGVRLVCDIVYLPLFAITTTVRCLRSPSSSSPLPFLSSRIHAWSTQTCYLPGYFSVLVGQLRAVC